MTASLPKIMNRKSGWRSAPGPPRDHHRGTVVAAHRVEPKCTGFGMAGGTLRCQDARALAAKWIPFADDNAVHSDQSRFHECDAPKLSRAKWIRSAVENRSSIENELIPSTWKQVQADLGGGP